MNASLTLDQAFARYSEAIIEYVQTHVRRSLELERDRIDAELLELRDLVADAAIRYQTPPAATEFELLNRRMAKLTETVSELMARIGPDESAGYSVKVPDADERE